VRYWRNTGEMINDGEILVRYCNTVILAGKRQQCPAVDLGGTRPRDIGEMLVRYSVYC
jgi:hypothetical protein